MLMMVYLIILSQPSTTDYVSLIKSTTVTRQTQTSVEIEKKNIQFYTKVTNLKQVQSNIKVQLLV